MEFDAGANHVTANEVVISELGGKFFCPDEGLLDGLLEGLTTDGFEKLYILQ
jgi:hypothetical protein